MADPIHLLGIYLHLARAAELGRRPHARDRLLIVAAALAADSMLPRVAALCRERVLEHNPNHLLRRWESLDEACEDSDFRHFLTQLQRRYPRERAERMLQESGLEMGNEREAYFTDEEYAAGLLGCSLDHLDRFGPAP
jgi:hypothetical protein